MTSQEARGSRGVEVRRQELGEFLRAQRGHLQPEDVGLPRRGTRRVKGLRRHEVADLASVSVTWYTWLEQGRAIRTTCEVIDSIARALSLDEVGRRYIRHLAGHPLAEGSPPAVVVESGLIDFLDMLLPSPACLIDTANDLRAWNNSYSRVFVDPDDLPEARRNALMIMLSSPVSDRLAEWKAQSEAAVQSFRAEVGKDPANPRFNEIVTILNRESDLFRDTWAEHQVRRFAGHVQVVDHPDVGRIRMNQLLFRPLGSPSLILMVHRLADQESRDRVAGLLA